MAITRPYIPEYITVHIGPPSKDGKNVTVTFQDYIKNVASSEIYPTWKPAALRANILAQISFALNRVYTEFYTSKGYPFQITSSTAYDQKFIPGRNIFENISLLVDQIFMQYIRRENFIEPLAAKFCNGTTVTCEGLSQWGSQDLAQQGLDSMEILRNYYGRNIELVTNAPVQGIQRSYPGVLKVGSSGEDVVVVQASINRISQSYPAIPKIYPVDGIYGRDTENAVKKFQSVFELNPDGIVGEATWYKLVNLYVGVARLSELVSEGQKYVDGAAQYPDTVRPGDRGERVKELQYMLAVLAEFNDELPMLNIDGIYGKDTANAVRAFQRRKNLPVTGIADRKTWDMIYRQFEGISNIVLSNNNLFPKGENTGASDDYSSTSRNTQYPGYSLSLGGRDSQEV